MRVGEAGGFGKEGQQIVGRFRGGAGGTDDGAVVLANDVQPRAEIICMPNGRDDAERRADEGGRELGHAFLDEVGLGAERSALVAPETFPGSRPMRQLMGGGAGEIDRDVEGARTWHLDVVVPGVVKGLVAAETKIGAAGLDEGVDRRRHDGVGNSGHRRRQRVGETVALVGVEDGEALQEGDAAAPVTVPAAARIVLARREAAGIDDGGAMLALAHAAAEPERLAEGEPVLGAEAVLDDGVPENEDVDTGVFSPRRGVSRHGQRGGGGGPGLDPGDAAGLQFGDDAVGDVLVE